MNSPDDRWSACHDEAARLAAVRNYRFADDGGRRQLEDIAALAARLCTAPVAFAGYVGARRTFVVSAVGITAARAGRLDLLCRHAIAQPGVFEIPDGARESRFDVRALVASEPGLRFFAAAPLISPLGHAVGALCVGDVAPRGLTIEQHGALAILAHLAIGQLELGLASLRDPLTGLYNRTRLDTVLARELANAVRRRSPLSVIGVDVDNLRRINDMCGDKSGDAALRAVGGVLACDAHPRHITCRLAGKRFVIVLPGIDANGAAERADALRQAVASLDLTVSPGVRPRITISAGIASCPEHGTSPEELLAEAGRALGLARGRGGNCIAVAPRELDFSSMALHALPVPGRRTSQPACAA
jgi:diguanylate cyclase (GGDEF)-like protein